MNYFNNINLNQNELQKAVMHPLAQAPATAKAGQMYYNTTDKKLYYYDGAKWIGLNDVDLTNYVTKTELSTDLDKKLDKVTTTTTNPQAYIKAADGTQSMQVIASSVSANTIAGRDSNGRLQVATAVNDLDAVNFGQMNKAIKVKDVTLDGESIVNDQGIVPLESTYHIDLQTQTSSGTLTQEQYDELAADDQSYLTRGSYVYRKQSQSDTSLLYAAMMQDGEYRYISIVKSSLGWTAASQILEELSNKKQTIAGDTNPVDHYPSIKAVTDYAFAKTGGTVNGAVTIAGDLTVKGTTTTVESATLKVKDQLIEVASGNTASLTSPAGLVVPKYDGTNNGALVFDNTGTAYVGDVVLDSEGLINTAASGTNLVALTGRDKEDNLTNNHILKWDATNKILIDTGIDAANILTSGELPTDYVSTSRTAQQTIKSNLVTTGDRFEVQKSSNNTYGDLSSENVTFIKNPGSSAQLRQYGQDTIVSQTGGTVTGTLTLPRDKTDTVAVLGDIPTSANYMTSTNAEQVLSDGVAKKLGRTSSFLINLVDLSNFGIRDSVDNKNLFSVVRNASDIANLAYVWLNAPLVLGATTEGNPGSAGASGQVLTSQGEGNVPIWTTINVPTSADYMTSTSATQDLTDGIVKRVGASKSVEWQLNNASSFTIRDNVNGTSLFSVVRNSTGSTNVDVITIQAPLSTGSVSTVGTAGQVLTSQGAGKAPQWTTLTIPQGTVKKFVQTFTGDGTKTMFNYTHGLSNGDCTVTLYKRASAGDTEYEVVMADITVSADSVYIQFAQAPTTSDSFKIVVTG